jgi:hypothetical protein
MCSVQYVDLWRWLTGGGFCAFVGLRQARLLYVRMYVQVCYRTATAVCIVRAALVLVGVPSGGFCDGQHQSMMSSRSWL